MNSVRDHWMVPIFGGVIVVSCQKNHIFFSPKKSCKLLAAKKHKKSCLGWCHTPPIFFWIKKVSRFQKPTRLTELFPRNVPPTTNHQLGVLQGVGDFSTYDKSIQKKVRHIVKMMYDEYFEFILVPVPTVFEFQLQQIRSSMYIYIYIDNALLSSYVFFGSWGRVRAWLSLSPSQIGTGAGDVGEHRSEAFPGKLLGKRFFFSSDVNLRFVSCVEKWETRESSQKFSCKSKMVENPTKTTWAGYSRCVLKWRTPQKRLFGKMCLVQQETNGLDPSLGDHTLPSVAFKLLFASLRLAFHIIFLWKKHSWR